MNRRPYSAAHEARALWQLAWPILVGQLATIGMGFADVAMTGHVSVGELASVSLGASVWSIVLVTVIGTMMSVNTLVAHASGAQDAARVQHVVRQGLWKAFGIGLLALVATNAATLVFGHLHLDPDIDRRASAFVHIISAGMPAFAAYRALYGYTTSINQTKPVMVIALGGLAWNVAVNWLLVFGHFGLPRLGALGCAISTASGMWLMLFALLWWIRRAPVYRATYPFARWEGPAFGEIGAMLRLGLPIGITYLAESSAFGAVGLLVARYGVVQVSAHQIALNFAALVFMVPLTFGIAMITRVGQALGEGDPLRARFVAWVGMSMSLAFAVSSALCIALFTGQIARLYTSDPAVQALAVTLLLLAAVFQLSDATQVAAASAMRAYKATREPLAIQLLAFWGVALPLGCVLGLAPRWLPFAPPAPMAARGFWIALAAGLTVAAVLLTVELARLANRRAREYLQR